MMLSIRSRTLLAILSVAGAASVLAQTPANGGFETGLTSWTTGGTNQAASITPANMPCCIAAAAEGTRFAALSTGPGDVAGGAASTVDGVGGANDFDAATLSATLNFNFSPAYLAFAWTFGSSEQDQANNFDDLFDVAIDGTVVFSRSAPKNNNSQYSNYPDAPRGGLTAANRLITAAAPITNSNLRFGIAPFQVGCVQIPATVVGPNTKTLRLRVADQTDAGFDSVVLIDDVRVVADCADVGAPQLQQVTTTAATTVEVKGGGLEFRAAQNRLPAADDTGRDFAFISGANLTGDNPNVIDQVFLWNGAAYSRVTGLNVLSGGQVQNVALSGDTRNGIRGRYVAIAAALSATDNLEIYRWDRLAPGALTTITTTASCDNRNPQINDDGTRIVFDSTCAALTGSGAQRRVVFWDNGAIASRPAGAAACFARLPRMSRSTSNRFVAFESNCDGISGANVDGNTEIYRWQRDNNTFSRMTTTAATVVNASPAIDAAGDNVFFISNLHNAAQQTEIYDWNGGNTRRTTSPGTIYYVGVRIDITGIRYAFERLNLATFASEIGHARTDQTGETVVAVDPGQLIPAFGIDGTNARISFGSGGDHAGSNPDANSEVFQFTGQ